MLSFIKSKGIAIVLNEADKKQISSYEKINKAIQSKNVLAYDIYINHKLIGFAMLREFNTGYFLWNYAIDSHYQRRGYGIKALKELLHFIRDHFGIKYFTTTYLYGNAHARHIYEKVGFKETDVVNDEGVHEVNMEIYLDY